jgi:hypothetical protein
MMIKLNVRPGTVFQCIARRWSNIREPWRFAGRPSWIVMPRLPATPGRHGAHSVYRQIPRIAEGNADS